MKTVLKRFIYNIVRPIHRPITRYLRERLTRGFIEYPEINLPEPWDFVQLQVERRLSDYLHSKPERIQTIVIVGANYADEIPRLKSTYPECSFICYEPSPKWFKMLQARYSSCPYVKCIDRAISDTVGQADFFELPMPGNGSLHEPNVELWAEFNKWPDKSKTSFKVDISTLDHEMKEIDSIDLLWVDIQGGEGRALTGAHETLRKTKAIFLEVALCKSPYEGALLFDELDRILRSTGFRCVGLGLDPWNYTGNAFWVKNVDGYICK